MQGPSPLIDDRAWFTAGSREDSLARAHLRNAKEDVLAEAPRIAGKETGDELFELLSFFASPFHGGTERSDDVRVVWLDDLNHEDSGKALLAAAPPEISTVYIAVEGLCFDLPWSVVARELNHREFAAFTPDAKWFVLGHYGELAVIGRPRWDQIAALARVSHFETPKGEIVSKDRLIVRFADGTERESDRFLDPKYEEAAMRPARILSRLSGIPIEHHRLTPWPRPPRSPRPARAPRHNSTPPAP